MSARQVMDTVDGLLTDGAVGFVATLAALLVGAPPAAGISVRSATDITRKRPRDKMPATANARLALTLSAADTDLVQPGVIDGRVELSLRYETFDANEDNLEAQAAYAATALGQVLRDKLREYSDAHGGTVVDVEQPIHFQFGEFDGPVAAGFIATVTILERSAE